MRSCPPCLHRIPSLALAALLLVVPACRPSASPAVAGPTPTDPGEAYREMAVQAGGTIEGRVVVEGRFPERRFMQVARRSDQTVCGTEKLSHEITLGSAGELRDAVVYLDGIQRGKPLSTLGSSVVRQKDCQYAPHLSVHPSGRSLTLRNEDPMLHNIHALHEGEETLFNLVMPRRGMQVTRPLPARGWVELKCDLHPWTNGVIWITPHPYAVASDKEGRFRLTEVPEGEHRLVAWHPLLGEAGQTLTVGAGKTHRTTLHFPPLR